MKRENLEETTEEKSIRFDAEEQERLMNKAEERGDVQLAEKHREAYNMLVDKYEEMRNNRLGG